MYNKRPTTTTVTVRMDLRKLATVIQFYYEKGIREPSMASYVRYIIEDIGEKLGKQGLAKEFIKTSEADEYIANLGIKRQRIASRNAEELLRELSLDEFEFGSSTEGGEETVLSAKEVIERMKDLTNG